MNTSVSGILGGKIIAIDKTGDHADVEGQVSKVVEQAGEDSFRSFDNCSIKNTPENYRDAQIKSDVTNHPAIWIPQRAESLVHIDSEGAFTVVVTKKKDGTGKNGTRQKNGNWGQAEK